MGGTTTYMPTPPPPAPADNTALYAMIGSMQKQNVQAVADTTAAQRQAMIDAQNRSAAQLTNQGNQEAQQYLGREQAYQQALDAQNKKLATQAAADVANASTGAPIDLVSEEANRVANLAGGVGMLPNTAANLAFLDTTSNPALKNVAKTTLSNKFTLPQTSGITFGGY